MKSRWKLNLVLLVLVVFIGVFLYSRPKEEVAATKDYEVSTLKLAGINHIRAEFPAKAAVAFEKINGYWYIEQPYKTRADQMMVQKVLSIVAAKSIQRFPAEDISRFGLDQPKLKLKLNEETFVFGTFNPVSGEQYVSYNGYVYLLPVNYSENAETQITEFIDKSPLKPDEKIAGFDFSGLEQFDSVPLSLDIVNNEWKASLAKAKVDQKAMAEWFDAYWRYIRVQSVEPYIPNSKAKYPSFDIKLTNGKKIYFEKLQESPEFLIGRPDEGMIYHVPADIGFVLLNPPVELPK
jgi:hypothetical protein